jgi:hypothetical protein
VKLTPRNCMSCEVPFLSTINGSHRCNKWNAKEEVALRLTHVPGDANVAGGQGQTGQ